MIFLLLLSLAVFYSYALKTCRAKKGENQCDFPFSLSHSFYFPFISSDIQFNLSVRIDAMHTHI